MSIIDLWSIFLSNEAILSAAIRDLSGGWNPEDRINKLDTGLCRYDVKVFPEIEIAYFRF
jgi:hypothetical protein